MVARIDCNKLGSGLTVDAYLVFAGSLKLEIVSQSRESEAAVFADGMGLACGEHEVVRLLALNDLPHSLDVIRGKAPVPHCVKVTEKEFFLQAFPDAGGCHRDLPRNERLAANRRLVIEEDSVRGVDAVRLSIVHGDPVGI